MKSIEHQKHLETRISHSVCCECRADTERRFTDRGTWKYDHVRVYLEYVRPLLIAIRSGKYTDDPDATIWLRKFIKALHTRISLKVHPNQGRKYSDGYLERLRMANRGRTDAGYLRQFASRGASCLD